ncbi:MAG: outer membrane beta-barrel protein [Puia sp.]|nr:outer membrane beta-barrel protein [Puia sp.]
MRRLLLLAGSFLGFNYATAQFVSGRVIDGATFKGISSASVSIWPRGSETAMSTVSEINGSFHLTILTKGRFKLTITAVGHKTLDSIIDLTPERPDLGLFILHNLEDTLTPAVVSAKVPAAVMHGDTMDYNTAHFRVAENAAVSALLAKLPGIQVNDDGSLLIGGKKVDKLLVDGEEIFGGSPGAVTKNLTADMIAKVQVLEKKSLQADFTGVDDGKRSTTVNLVLKDNSKQVTLKKIQAGGNPSGYYDASAVEAGFKKKRQFVVIGMMDNVGSSQVNTTVADHSAGLNLQRDNNDPLGGSAGIGIPLVAGAGLHYANDWGVGVHINANGQYGYTTTNPTSVLLNRQLLPDSIYLQEQTNRSSNYQSKQQSAVLIEDKLDSLSALQIYAQGQTSIGGNRLVSSGSSWFNDSLINKSLRTIDDKTSNYYVSLYGTWRQFFNKSGRNLSLSLGLASSSDKGNGLLYSIATFTGVPPMASDTIDQRKDLSNRTIAISGSMDYVEPVTKLLNVALSYNFSSSTNNATIGTFSRSGQKYNNIIDSLSSEYKDVTLDQHMSVGVQGQNRSFSYSIMADVQSYTITQNDQAQHNSIDYYFLFFAPRATLLYNFDPYDRLSLYYGTSFQAPNPTQLQQVQNNTDPLHINEGNPTLKTGVGRALNMSFFKTRPFFVSVGLQYNYTTSDISVKTEIDSLGRQISQPVNVPGSRNFTASTFASRTLMSSGIEFGVTSAISLAANYSFVNQDLSNNRNATARAGLFVIKSVADKYAFEARFNLSYSTTSSSINILGNTHFWQQDHLLRGSVFLFPKFEFLNTVAYTWRQKLTPFDGINSTFIYGFGLRRYAVHNLLIISWQIDDLFNQNIGLSRSILGSQITETTTNALGRHWLFSLSYQFPRRSK